MPKSILLLIVIFLWFDSLAQVQTIKELKRQLKIIEQQPNHLNDTLYFSTINKLAFLYADSYPDSAISILKGVAEQCKNIAYQKGSVDTYGAYGNALQTKGNFDSALNYYIKALDLANKSNAHESLPAILGNIGLIYFNQGNYPIALQKFYASLKAAEEENNQLVIRNSSNNIGTIYFYQGKMKEAEEAYTNTLKISKELSDTANVILAYNNIAEVNLEENNIHKALSNLSTAYQLLQQKNSPDMLVAVSNSLGDCYYRLNEITKASEYFEKALEISKKTDNARATCKALIGLAKVNNKIGTYKKALEYGKEALKKANEMRQAQLQRDALEVVANSYEQAGDGMNSLKYYKEFRRFSDSLVNIENIKAAANLKAGYEFSKKEEEFQRKTFQQKWMMFSALAAFLITLIIIWVVYRNKKRLSHMYSQLENKNEVIEGQKRKAEETLAQLKATQKQLIQVEKMASLGELTAGIAHEIQNPLNFVNNFSDVSKEMIQEIIEERTKNKEDRDEAIQDEILEDISKNLEKISQHGNRASNIVKGMLEHSRNGSGKKELTDINALCKEFLHLSYHGLRAKDKSFHADFETHFDESIGKIDIVPQDIGRVVLNLINNAFYASNERSEKAMIEKPNAESFKPMVTISTKKVDGKIEINIADNGNGIPKNIIDKIFQPFFTTKPTGKGTGLGLSLSYDIVKAHGGELRVNSEQNIGTDFTILLPIKE